MLTVVPDLPAALAADRASSSLIDQIVREGAMQMLAAAPHRMAENLEHAAGQDPRTAPT